MTLPVASFIGCLFAGFFAGLLQAKQSTVIAGHAALYGLLIGVACYIVVSRIGGSFEDKFVQRHRDTLASVVYLAKYMIPGFLSFLLSWLFAKILLNHAV